MQKIFTFILFTAFLGQSFDQGFYYIDYLVQKEAYLRKCINKSRPALHCNGKCQLMKKLEAQAKKDLEQVPALKLAAKTELFKGSYRFQLKAPVAFLIKQAGFLIKNSGSPIHQARFVFRPPAFQC